MSSPILPDSEAGATPASEMALCGIWTTNYHKVHAIGQCAVEPSGASPPWSRTAMLIQKSSNMSTDSLTSCSPSPGWRPGSIPKTKQFTPDHHRKTHQDTSPLRAPQTSGRRQAKKTTEKPCVKMVAVLLSKMVLQPLLRSNVWVLLFDT